MALTSFPASMRRLVNELTKLPSIGEKSAIRLAYHLLLCDSADNRALAEAILEARERTTLCLRCFAFCEGELCAICEDFKRDHAVICVVEKPSDVLALERSGGFHGIYHVLHGLWSPMKGVGPERTKLPQLFERIRKANDSEHGSIREVVLATGATVEGDATAMYIARAVSELGIIATRIAQGLPKGGELEYADEITLSHALRGRRNISSE